MAEVGFFKKLSAESENTPTPATGNGQTRNVAVKVTSFDVPNNATTGIDIVTGEEVTIKLRELGKSFEKQGGVASWSKKGKTCVATGEEGGTIVFESVIRDAEGGLSSRWGVVAAHATTDRQDRAIDVEKVFSRPAVSFKNRAELDEKRAIEIARIDQSQRVSGEGELKAVLAEILSRPYTVAVVRAFDGEEIRVANVWKGKDATPEQAADNFRKTNNYLGRHLSDDGVQAMQAVEVFPLERVYAGMDYREMLRDASKLEAQRFSRDWSLGEGKGWGFGESLVAFRTHEEGGRFITMVLPSVNRQPLWTLESIPSAHIKPPVAPSLSDDKLSQQAPEKAAEQAPAPAQKSAPAESSETTPVMTDEARSEVANKIAAGAKLFRR